MFPKVGKLKIAQSSGTLHLPGPSPTAITVWTSTSKSNVLDCGFTVVIAESWLSVNPQCRATTAFSTVGLVTSWE